MQISLISTFVIRLLESIISKLAPGEILIFWLVSVAEEIDFSLAFLENQKTVLNPITVYSYGFLFNCTTVGQASDSMTALT